jgi:poly-gamma-glutamate synthesis protein (capsule biosynthesis protein)
MSVVVLVGDVWLRAPRPGAARFTEPVVINLEAPVTRRSVGYPGKINLRSDALYVSDAIGATPLAAQLANNHCLDFFAEGLDDTCRALDAERIPFFGAGRDEQNMRNPIVVPVGDHRLGLCGYVCATANPVFAAGDAPGVAPIDTARIAADVAEARRLGATRVVVCVHWGVEEVHLPRPEDRTLARQIVATGADLVVGTHAHVLQPWERIDGVMVFYGLGNFMFSDIDGPGEFNTAGVSTRHMKKHWQAWNRRSLGVRYDLATGVAEPLGFFDRGTTVASRSARSVGGRELTAPNDDAYRRRFDRAYTYGLLRAKAGAFFANPKVPRLRHLKSLSRIAREVTSAAPGRPDA